MAFDYTTFASELGMAAEDRTALDALFGKYPTAATKIDAFLDSQVTSRLTPLQTQFEAKQRDLDAQFETLASIRTGDSDQFDKLQRQMEETAAQKAVLESRLRKVAGDAGIDADALLKDLKAEPVAPVVRSDVPVYDPRTVEASTNRAALTALHNSLLADDIADEHFALFGTRLSRVELLGKLQETVKRTNNPSLGLKEVWQSAYGVDAKRAEITEQGVQRRIAEAVAQKEQAIRDEIALRPINSEQPHFHTETPIMAALSKEQRDTPIRVGGVPEGVQAAVAAFRKARAA